MRSCFALALLLLASAAAGEQPADPTAVPKFDFADAAANYLMRVRGSD